MSNAEISFGRVKMQLKIGAIMMLATVCDIVEKCRLALTSGLMRLFNVIKRDKLY